MNRAMDSVGTEQVAFILVSHQTLNASWSLSFLTELPYARRLYAGRGELFWVVDSRQRTIPKWNQLSADCSHDSSINMFKNRIDQCRFRARVVHIIG